MVEDLRMVTAFSEISVATNENGDDSIPKLQFELGVSRLGVILYSEWPRICEKQVFYHERIEKG